MEYGMDTDLLAKHIHQYRSWLARESEKAKSELQERRELIAYYQGFSRDKILSMSEEELYQYISRLWAMLIWGNKQYVVDKLLENNGLDFLKQELADLVWGKEKIEQRWDRFRKNIKGMGPAMISEILCKAHPDQFLLWNRRAFVALRYLQVDRLPRYDYQLTGQVYSYLCDIGQQISREMARAAIEDTSMLSVDYFIWCELQVEDNLSRMHDKKEDSAGPIAEPLAVTENLHNDVRDKLRDIGQWLGFTAKIEQKVADGSQVDAVWESTIGNMGRVIYVFEVQTKGSIDSLIVNLLKSLNNPAVQGVVAVSDRDQLERIKKHAKDVVGLRDKLKYWDYEQVLKTHESLEYVNNCINQLELVPQGF